ncbi:MAG: TonB-dependent receptor [Steroidobacteraceae bacterium]
MKSPIALLVATGALVPLAATAAQGLPEKTELTTITVTASKLRVLEQETPTSSRLGLTARETPATIDTIDSDEMLGRGYPTIEFATASMPGVITGGSPGDLADFSMRGFSGQQIYLLHNGLAIGPSNMVNRPMNTFNLERVEILKGPSSVLYGQGAIGGVVNIVNKRPSYSDVPLEIAGSIGRFGTTAIGIGGGTHWGDSLAVRADVSRTASDGYVENSPSDSLSISAGVSWKPSENVEWRFLLDYLEDHPSAYFGTPLVTNAFATQRLNGVLTSDSGLTLDKRLRYVNYNVGDSRIDSKQYWPQLELTWKINDSLTLQNNAYYFDATRKWINSEVYAFNSATNLIDRDRFFVFHDQQLYGDQLSLTQNGSIGGHANTFVVGLDYSNLDFMRSRGFPDGDSVNPFNPNPGVFGDIVERKSPTKWDSTALFFEDVVAVTPAMKLVLGGRFDSLDLDRKNYGPTGAFQAASSFNRTFNGSNWRVGLVYNVTPNITPYLSFNTGQDPVGSNVFLVNANQNFDLSDARQVEAGVKVTTNDRRGDLTFALYDIKRKNILTQINNLGDLSNVGEQKSRGFEVAGNLRPIDPLTVSVNLAYTDAKYGRFFDPDFGVDATGNVPANSPKWVANLWTNYVGVAGTPLELGGAIRYVSSREGDSANTLHLDPYTLVNLHAGYRLATNLMLTARVNNVFDKAYAQWADVFYPTEVLLGSPRTYEFGFVGRF